MPPAAEATTLICVVPVGVTFWTGELELLELHPHATTPVDVAKRQRSRNAGVAAFCFPGFLTLSRRAKVRRPKMASGVTGFGRPGKLKKGWAADPEPVVLMVSMVVVDAPCGVICTGLKLQLAPIGNPEQAKDTALFRLGAVVSVIVKIADAPAETVALAGEALTANDAAFVPTVCMIGAEVLVWKSPSPL